MELMACIKALEEARGHKKIDAVRKIYLFTDSMYVRDHLNRAKYDWPKRRWKNRYGQPIENSELWKELIRQIQKLSPLRVEFKWTRGHSKNKHNKAVDKLAKQSANGHLNPPLAVETVRRKKTKESTELGSVNLRGQIFAIRIITDKYLKLQKVYRYKYEVISEDSEFYGKIDRIFSKELLRAGHHYEVQVNDDMKYPRIVEVLGELERG